ncbi:MAG TPA: DNA-directed RNA polymerase subunit D, partial [Patescibacteria group bacterium]|nr:DNA-directed RNA polymerase subunit D [Patescibacteria group bacterium]
MEILDKKQNQITFRAEISDSLANAIRRYVNQIPVLAIDEVEIYKNDSPLYDETVAHRIGLIPLNMDKSVSEKTEMELKLTAKGEGMIYSGQLKGALGVVYDRIPITSLGEDGELQIVAYAKTGKGSEHSKFSPGLIYYRHIVEIKTDVDLYDKFKEVFPDNLIKKEGKSLSILDDKRKEISDACEEICREAGKKIEIIPKEELIITIESFGQIEVNDLLKKI